MIGEQIIRESYQQPAEMRADTFFCDLTDEALRRTDLVKATEHTKGSVIFVEGQTAHGVHVLRRGRVKLSASSGEARVIITGIAEPGDVLGLSAVISRAPYEVTAEALGACQLVFIKREEFLRLLEVNAGAALRATRQLSRSYRTTHRQVRLLGLSNSAACKLAGLLLDCAARHGAQTADGVALKLTLTHEEIGQIIGASRETVTRLFSDFKRRQLLKVTGATLHLRNLAALAELTLP